MIVNNAWNGMSQDVTSMVFMLAGAVALAVEHALTDGEL
jgi:hypothetical protein